MKRIVLLGSTGSIGRQTLEVIDRHPDRCRIVGIAARSDVEGLCAQYRRHEPERVALTGGSVEQLTAHGVPAEKALAGENALLELLNTVECDLVVNAVTGAAGLPANFVAIDRGCDLALANKESLVVAGPLLLRNARERGTSIIPVDSEHSAILQCLSAGRRDELKRIVLTASGGPFRQTPLDEFPNLTVEQALKHPTWQMGAKISIDSATLMNKALEILEAQVLFGLSTSEITVVVHPESIVHSMVEFVDGSTIAHMGPPDMRVPIQFAISSPERWPGGEPSPNWPELGPLNFETPDPERFPAIELALRCCEEPASSRVVLNAANEIAVAAFLERRILFSDIVCLVRRALDEHDPQPIEDLTEIFELDHNTRESVAEWTS